MKKLLALLLVLVLVLSFAACSGNKADTDDEKKPAQSQNKNDDDNSTDDQPEDDQPEDDGAKAEELSFTEVVVLDNEQCLIKITGIDPDDLFGYTLKAYFENKYMFSVDNATINGVQCDPYFAAEVAAGKKSNESISFTVDVLEENGVGDFTDIELSFGVYDSEDWLADPVAEETVHIYPYGEDKAVKFVREAQDTDKVLIDNEYVTLIATGTEEDEFWGYTVNLFMVNKTDKNLMFSVENASVNGFMADPFFAQDVFAGNCSFSSMSWDTEELTASGITDVEEIEFTLCVYDEDDLTADNLVNEVIKFNP